MCIWSLYFFFFDCRWQVYQSIHELHPRCDYDKMDPVAEKHFPKRWSAFCDDCNRWKCFTTHFHSFVVINKTALNCIHLYFQFLFKWFEKEMEVTFKGSNSYLDIHVYTVYIFFSIRPVQRKVCYVAVEFLECNLTMQHLLRKSALKTQC